VRFSGCRWNLPSSWMGGNFVKQFFANILGEELPYDRAKVSDLSMRSWYVDLVGGVRAWRSNYTCEARAPMQSLGQSPGVTDLADARSAWPARVLIPTCNREQVRTNTAIKILQMKDVCFIQRWDSE
jgi:hypothetical protein